MLEAATYCAVTVRHNAHRKMASQLPISGMTAQHRAAWPPVLAPSTATACSTAKYTKSQHIVTVNIIMKVTYLSDPRDLSKQMTEADFALLNML